MGMNANLYGSGTTSDDMQRTAFSEREKDVENKPKTDNQLRRYWREIERYRRATSGWYEEGDQICQVYMDETGASSTRRFALPSMPRRRTCFAPGATVIEIRQPAPLPS
jgi:hypothetical protein